MEQPVATDAPGAYRQFIPDLSQPRFLTMKQQNAHEYVSSFKSKHQPPWLYALYKHWRSLFEEPYKGITTDGTVRHNLFQLQDEGIEIEQIVAAAEDILSTITEEQQETLCYHVDSPEWRSWSNPEFLLSHKGLRLDEISSATRSAILNVLSASLSPEGYDKAISAMRVNHFLGGIVGAPTVMNEYSYNFVLFGRPSSNRPWGWSFYGHHLCLNAFFYERQIVISPWFTGAEPNEIDEGPYAGTRILQREESLGLKLMQSLPSPLQEKVQIYKKMKDPKMPAGRWNRYFCRVHCFNDVQHGMLTYSHQRRPTTSLWSI